MILDFNRGAKNSAMRRRTFIKGGILILVAAFLLCGCGAGRDNNAAQSLAGKTYVYTGETFSKIEEDLFKISFHEDGTYAYVESLLSSYLGFGTWEIKDGMLTLTDNAQSGYAIQNSFRIDGDELVFSEEGSSNFIYVKVKDGERFVSAADTEK